MFGADAPMLIQIDPSGTYALQDLAVSAHILIFCHRTVKTFDMVVQPVDDIFLNLSYERLRRSLLLFQHLMQFFYDSAKLLMLFFVLLNSRIGDGFLQLFFFSEMKSVYLQDNPAS